MDWGPWERPLLPCGLGSQWKTSFCLSFSSIVTLEPGRLLASPSLTSGGGGIRQGPDMHPHPEPPSRLQTRGFRQEEAQRPGHAPECW